MGIEGRLETEGEFQTTEDMQQIESWLEGKVNEGTAQIIISGDTNDARALCLYTVNGEPVVLLTNQHGDPYDAVYGEKIAQELAKAGVIFERGSHSAIPPGGSL